MINAESTLRQLESQIRCQNHKEVAAWYLLAGYLFFLAGRSPLPDGTFVSLLKPETGSLEIFQASSRTTGSRIRSHGFHRHFQGGHPPLVVHFTSPEQLSYFLTRTRHPPSPFNVPTVHRSSKFTTPDFLGPPTIWAPQMVRTLGSVQNTIHSRSSPGRLIRLSEAEGWRFYQLQTKMSFIPLENTTVTTANRLPRSPHLL